MFESDEFNDTREDIEKYWNTASSTIFLVDATEQMYQNNHLLLCLQTYRNIIRQKCCNNKKDKMGLVLFGTKDTNCEVDNVRVLQDFETVTIDSLKKIRDIFNDEEIIKFNNSAASDQYPLFNALSYVFQALHAFKSNVKASSTVVLCTCHAHPLVKSDQELRRIEHLVATFKDTRTKLLVVGLGDSWNDGVFYKDLQLVSGTFDHDNYKTISLKDLERTISSPARSICKLMWKITPNISVPVTLINLISKSKYPSKVKVQKDTNEILETHRILEEVKSEDITLDDTMVNRFEQTRGKIITDENIMHYKIYCGQNIYFKPEEIKKMKNLCTEPSIELLAFKPIACDPLYHCKPPNFVTCSTLCNNENKVFFRSFVYKCSKKKVMPMCKIATNTTFFIGMMIPSEYDGGFYVYKMPFKDKIRYLDERLSDYIFNDERKCPTNPEAVYMFKKLMDHTKVKFDPMVFKNPKLEKYFAHIEALALDDELSALPPDSTLPPPMSQEMETVSVGIMKLLSLSDKASQKRAVMQKSTKATKRQKLDVKTMVELGKLHTLTVPELKEALKDIKLPTTGTKSTLIQRIIDYYK
ncbi:X-ray repair cross-complementing protein 5-like [Copidosoma floridanum]|uniref:X-ray repair cross-complementing protein 5-like n=1 Tax=Copidosoma floridanum TaxID=29053 RepID=UPI000C6FB558|nr:X-ray repair cross-complementing protein 5-like [Copidosoma floridanum]